jgi:hypothetical protein
MTDSLATRISLSEAVAIYEAAERDIREGMAKLAGASRELSRVFGSSHHRQVAAAPPGERRRRAR